MVEVEVILTVVHHICPAVIVSLNTVGDSRHLLSLILGSRDSELKIMHFHYVSDPIINGN